MKPNKSQKILLTLLGIGDYTETQYSFGESRAKPACFVAVAIAEICKPDLTMVVMTNKAEEKHAQKLAEKIPFVKISIPDGKNEDELWLIFQQISDAIPPNIQLIIDVTHGFRSQPMILLAIAVYLQITKSVTIANILYGAYDNKEQPGITPLFDINPFLELINWSFAASHFMRTGDADLLSELIIPIHADQHRSKQAYRPRKLKGVGQNLKSISEAFAVVRPNEIGAYAMRLKSIIPDCFKDVENINKVKPFKVLLEEIEHRFSRVAFNSKEQMARNSLQAQVEMIKLYINNRQYQQAITLARELMVTKIEMEMEIEIKSDALDGRKLAEDKLNGLTTASLPKEITDIWRSLGDFRNDINHAGMGRKQPKPASKLIEQIKIKCMNVCDYIAGSL